MVFSYQNIKEFFTRLYDKAFDKDIFNSSAQVAFYFTFALFPLFLFLVSLFGLILGSAEDLRGELFYYIRQVMPPSSYTLVKDTIMEVTKNSTGGKITMGILIALWSASAGFDSLRTALNLVYNLNERRAWWKTKLQSLLFTLIITLLTIIALAIVFYGWKFISFSLSAMGLPVPSQFFLILIQWIAILILLLSVFGIIYNFAPSHHPFKLIWITPGAITGIVLWLLLSFAFRTYLQYYNTYNRLYGSLGAVIILMLWLYLTALVILIGGVINSVLQEMSQPPIEETTEENIVRIARDNDDAFVKEEE